MKVQYIKDKQTPHISSLSFPHLVYITLWADDD